MIDQGYGKIINLSCGGATASRPRFSAYAASQAGVVRLTETVAEEMREYGVQVNAVSPGAVNTHMLDEVLAAGSAAGQEARAKAKHQLETGGTAPKLTAALVVFLASEEPGELTDKLISAPHDGWQSWDAGRASELMSSSWLTLRRMDPFSLRSFLVWISHLGPLG